MARAAYAPASAGYNYDELLLRLKSFGKTLFLKLVDSRMETAKYRMKALTPSTGNLSK